MSRVLNSLHYLSKIKRFVLNRSIFQNLLRYCCLIMIIFLSSFHEKYPTNEVSLPPYAVIERTIRDKYDSYAVFNWYQYTELLDKLSQDKFTVLPLNEMRKEFSDSKVVVGLRHDVDANPFKALEMAKIEKLYGIRATYFFLVTAEYYGEIISSKITRSPGIENIFKEIYNTGAEIGIHNDLLTVMILNKADPFVFNSEEMKFYKSLKIPIYGTSAHGSPVAKKSIPNFQIFSDFTKCDSVEYQGKKYPIGQHSLQEYGFKYEASNINYGIYLSDAGGKWNDPDGLTGIMKKLDSSKPGDRIEILVHPDWWGRK
jgi:hypothetical protein